MDRGFFTKVKEEFKDNTLWRTTTYKRLDGSIFHVSIPISAEIKNNFSGEKEHTGHKYYNERAEYEMALSIFKRNKKSNIVAEFAAFERREKINDNEETK